MSGWNPEVRVVRLFSNDHGQTFDGLGLGRLFINSSANQSAKQAGEDTGIDISGFVMHGTADYTGDGDESILGVVGITFRKPLAAEDAVVFAGAMVAGTNVLSVDLHQNGNSEPLDSVDLMF